MWSWPDISWMDFWIKKVREWDLSQIESWWEKRYDRNRIGRETKELLVKPLPWKWNSVSLTELRESQKWNKLFDKQLKHTPMGQEEFYRARKNPDITK